MAHSNYYCNGLALILVAICSARVIDFGPKPEFNFPFRRPDIFWTFQDNLTDTYYWSNLTANFLSDHMKRNVTPLECIQTSIGKEYLEKQSLKDFYPCTEENFFGYGDGTPCIFIKLDATNIKMSGFIPEEFEKEAYKLPQDMPKDLKEYIDTQRSLDKRHDNLWISCEGFSDDKGLEKIPGPIEYYPNRMFRGNIFPIKNPSTFRGPLIAVQFKNPTKSRFMNIICKAWAMNCSPDHRYQIGAVSLNLMVDTFNYNNYVSISTEPGRYRDPYNTIVYVRIKNDTN